MRVSIRSKIIIIAILIPSLAVGASTFIWNREFKEVYANALQSETMVIADHLAHQLNEILELGIPLEDVVGFQKGLKDIVAGHEYICHAMVVGLDGRILFHSDTARQGKMVIDPAIIHSIRSGKRSTGIYKYQAEEHYEAHIPVLGPNGEHVAAVRLGFPATIVDGKVGDVIRNSALVALVILLLAVIFLIIAQSVWVTRPLGSLVSLIREIRKQGTSVNRRIEIRTRDEIGELGSALNEMMDHLREADEKLRNFNYHLQKEVERRTGELSAATQQLKEEIEERRRREKALRASDEKLRKSEEKFRKVVHNAPVWVILSTLDEGRLLEVNEASLKMTGFKREEAIGRTIKELGIWDDPEDLKRFVTMLREEGSVRNFEGKLRDKTGNVVEAVINAELIELEGEEVVISLIQDMTEHNRLEEEFRQAQKMEAVGTLAGGVAHDFNNLMTTVIGNVHLAMDEIPKGNPLREMLTDIRKAGESAASLARQLLAFSRKQVLRPEVLDLNSVLADMKTLLRRVMREDIEFELILGPELEPVKVDPTQIEQVVINLVVNATDAMPRGGKLIIETATMEIDKDYFSRHSVEGETGPYVMLSVTDTGVGMDKETISKVFEPFFTTKEKGVGTGLGLSTVYGIVKQSGGFIWVYSEPGQGTTFKVYMPAVEGDEAYRERRHEWAGDQFQGSETVLLVEDSDNVRKLVSKGLGKLGYTVLEASDGEEAVKISREYQGSIDLLLTDVVMPKMSGVEVMEKLGRERPKMKVLYMSGYTGKVISQRMVLGSGVDYLQKPFSPGELARRVREVLDK
ncbi:MAG: response regulator [Deltaproteobacteria bacterium]|nr:response regulator [Deltaproteobacteria bacterium]